MNLIQAWLHWFSGDKLAEDTTVCVILCWKLLVWARWGKIIQLISATTIIADIIGPEKLRETGESLRRSFPRDASKRYFLKTTRWLRGFYEPIILKGEEDDIRVGYIVGELSREEYANQMATLREKEKLDPYTRKDLESFTSWIYRIFRQSLLDKFNVVCSLAILIIYGIPLAKQSYSFMLNASISFHPNLIWEPYVGALCFPLFILIFGFFLSLFFISPIVVSAIIFGLTFFVSIFDFLIIRGTAWLLERPKVENWIKIISLIFLLVGFHFDLLAS